MSFDFTAPTLVSSRASPTLAKLGDELTYSVAASEPLVGHAGADRHRARRAGPHASLRARTYSYQPPGRPARHADGAYAVSMALTDLVGNTATGIAGASFSLT